MRPYRPLKKAQPRVAGGDLRLSLCMIVKNEAATLDKCLSLARPHVDEIVVIDTGSTDGTQDIARRYADVFEEIEWPGSFADARNYSLDRATGTHIFILDGDEWIEDAAAWAEIRAAAARPDLGVGMVRVRNLLGSGLLDSDFFYQERLYPNHPSIRYDGRVHNQILHRIEAHARQMRTRSYQLAAEITHVGYSYDLDRKKAKYAPRVALMEQERAEADTPEVRAYYTFQLAVVEVVLEHHARVLELAGELDFAALSDQNAYYAHQITAEAALKLGQPGLAAVHSDAMLRLDRDEPVGYFLTGFALLALDRRLDGFLLLAEAGRLNERRGDEARFRLNLRHVLVEIQRWFERFGMQRQALLVQKVAADGAYTRELGDALLEDMQREMILHEAGLL